MNREDESSFERTNGAIGYLMSRFAVHRSLWIARAIVHHLEALSIHADLRQLKSYEQLLITWQRVAEDFEKERLGKDHGWRFSIRSLYPRRAIENGWAA